MNHSHRRAKPYHRLPPYLRRKFLRKLTKDLQTYVGHEVVVGIMNRQAVTSVTILQAAVWELARRIAEQEKPQ